MITSDTPACWAWAASVADVAHAARCPESYGHVLLWNWQLGRCAACGVDGVLHRDHDHATGLLRGLLCRRCNSLEGFTAVVTVPGYTAPHGTGDGKRRSFARWSARPDIRQVTECLARYRAKHPTAQLGLVARYEKTSHPYGVPLPRVYTGPLPLPEPATRKESDRA